MLKFLCLSAIIFVFTACNNSGNHRETTPVPSTGTTINSASTPANKIIDTTPKATNPTGQVPPVISTTTKTPAKNNAAINPAHGQPGHRCDIPEGAPLNSPAVTNATVPPNTQNVNKPVSPQQPPAKSNVKLNPAHGQPGHDCAIAVGQPLKS